MYRPQLSQEGTQLACLALAKFSYTTTSVSHRGPFNWSHIIGNGDITCLFERHAGSRLLYSRVLLKVMRDHDVLEQIDITHFSRNTMDKTQPSQHGQTKPIFAVVVKLPCLAVKYPEESGYIRRFQIKFSLERDFYSALSILSDMKCPFSESNPSSISTTRRLASSQFPAGPVPPTPHLMGTFSNVSGTAGIPALSIPPSPLYSPSMGLPVLTPDPTHAAVNPSSCTTSIGHSALNDCQSSQRQNSISVTAPMRQSLLHASSDGTSTGATSRPSTATICHDIQTLNQLLPPKRDLPFSKQQAKRLYPALLPQPSTTSHTEEAYNTTPITATQPTFSTPVLPLNQIATNEMLKSGVITLKYRPSSQPQSVQIGPTRSQVFHGPDIMQPIMTPHILPTTTHQLPAAIQQDTSSIMDQRPTTENNHQQPRHNLLTEADLSAYLAFPTTERTRKLENWICRSIEDDEFLQLCEDVEGIWRRFALGK
ncbi:hypothetical protein BDV26DRAFT_268771 [Aspergillus bertholletiae]|uniref:Uncharacterized protein n=1 Tax=Aspergillus bertholletiae TaxID=1226010 RepID=A0A5N7AZ08_9EURO|nr:hypothetical protein BDV26DRAFT_268771 [Aspergillus bertholletiae]